jgi:hypothetical protein
MELIFGKQLESIPEFGVEYVIGVAKQKFGISRSEGGL